MSFREFKTEKQAFKRVVKLRRLWPEFDFEVEQINYRLTYAIVVSKAGKRLAYAL